MFSDEELEGFGDNLQKFRTTNFQHQRDLQALLKKQEDLLESYQRLKSDYEEERESREKYKKLARGKEQGKSYVLVLIDGNTYTVSFPSRATTNRLTISSLVRN